MRKKRIPDVSCQRQAGYNFPVGGLVGRLTNRLACRLEQWQASVSLQTRNIWVLSLLGIVLFYAFLQLISVLV